MSKNALSRCFFNATTVKSYQSGNYRYFPGFSIKLQNKPKNESIKPILKNESIKPIPKIGIKIQDTLKTSLKKKEIPDLKLESKKESNDDFSSDNSEEVIIK